MTKKILVVEDDAGILTTLQFLLTDAGYDVETAGNGETVTEELDGYKPDLILLDYWLPGLNGGEVTRILKNRLETQNIPVIIISASYNIKDLVRAAGADDFLPKPYDLDELLGKVEKHLSH